MIFIMLFYRQKFVTQLARFMRLQLYSVPFGNNVVLNRRLL